MFFKYVTRTNQTNTDMMSFLCRFQSQQELDQTLELEELLTSTDKVKDMEFSSNRCIER